MTKNKPTVQTNTKYITYICSVKVDHKLETIAAPACIISAAKPSAGRGRPRGSGKNDRKNLEAMLEMLIEGKAKNPTDAARQQAARISKGAFEEATFDRLRHKFMKTYSTGEDG